MSGQIMELMQMLSMLFEAFRAAHLNTKTMSCPTLCVLARFDEDPGVPTILHIRNEMWVDSRPSLPKYLD